MEAKLLERLQPSTDTTDAMREAATRIREQRAANNTKLAEIKERRAKTLLTGTAKQVAAIELESRELEIEIEQLDEMLSALQPRFVAAWASELGDKFQSEHARAAEKIEIAQRFWHDEYPALSSAIAAGLNKIAAAESALDDLLSEATRLRTNDAIAATGKIEIDLPSCPKTYVTGVGDVSPTMTVQLPRGPDDERSPWWPLPWLYGRPRPPHNDYPLPIPLPMTPLPR